MKVKFKKKFLIAIFTIAILLFIGLYFIIAYHEPNILDSDNKKWIQENSGKLIDISIVNDIPLYANDGKGVIFDFLNYITEQSTLEFNKIPYLKNSNPSNSEYKIEIIDGSSKLTNKQKLIYEDSYIVLGKKDQILNDVYDLNGMTIGVLTSDSSNISYYLKSVNNIKYKNYDTSDLLFTSLNNNEVNMIIIPNIMYLDNTINNEYYTNYFFPEITKKVVLTLSDRNEELNDIFIKSYNRWFNEYYVEDYNKLFLDYYINKKQVNDKTKADLLSKTYVYGYVENAPYEFKMANSIEGIAIEYINRVIRLTDIDITYKKYNSISELNNAISKGEIDIYFDYINNQDSKYLKTKSVFIEKYVVLGKENLGDVTNTLESLKGKNVNMLANNYLYSYIKNNSMANINKCNNIHCLTDNDNLIITDREIYTYYRNNEFKKYEVLAIDNMTSDYTFMVKSNNESFFNLFDYIINTNSYYNYRNMAYNNINLSIFEKVSFEELYLLILGIILLPVFIGVMILILIKNKRKIKHVKREDRKKYVDMLTSLKNRNYLNLNIEKWNNDKVYPQTVIVIDLNNMKYINDNYGREKGDMIIVRAASILVNSQLENSEIIRSDGNEFLIYMIGYTENQVDIYTQKLSKALKELPYGYGAAIGYSMIIDNIKTIDDAINEATIEMQSDKESYK